MMRYLSGSTGLVIAVLGAFYLLGVAGIKLWRGHSRIEILDQQVAAVDARLESARQVQALRAAFIARARQGKRIHSRTSVETLSQNVRTALREGAPQSEIKLLALQQTPLPVEGGLQAIGFDLEMSIPEMEAISILRQLEDARPGLFITLLNLKGPQDAGTVEQTALKAKAFALMER